MTGNLTIPLTCYTKTDANGEPLCKRIGIGPDGLPLADASICKMSSGEARHIELQGGLAGLVPLFTSMTSMQAISLGAIVPEHRPAAGETVLITTKKRYEALAATGKLNRGKRKTIARTKQLITYTDGHPAALLFDFDTKGMPATIAARIKAAGSVWNLLVEALPFLKDVERVERASTSAGLIGPNGQRFAGSGGVHFYLLIHDGTDAIRALKNLRDRLWLAGLGWLVLSKSGAVLPPRALLDASVGGAERLAFEGPPDLLDGLTQDQEARRPVHTAGEMLDTRATLPELTAAEEHELEKLIATARQIIKPAQEKAVREIVEKEAKAIVAKTGVPIEKARAKAKERVRQRLEEHILGPDHPLQFDDIGLATVADVLADPDRYVGEALADPLEGINYGATTAKVFWGHDGRGPMIHSFAHGGLKYRLVHDEEAIEQALAASDPKDTAAILAKMLVQSAYGEKGPEEDRLITLAAKHAKANKRPIQQAIKNARSAAAKTAAVARAQWRQQQAAAAGVPDWRERDKYGHPIPSMHNARLAIIAIGVACSYDTFHNEMLFGYKHEAVRHVVEHMLGEVSDDGIIALRLLLSNRFGFDLTDTHVRDGVKSLALEHCFDPVADMLAEAQGAWDGVARLDRAAATHFSCEDTKLNGACMRKTLIAGVRRVRQPGCKFDTIPVLESPEGWNKSTAWLVMAGGEKNFSDESIIGKNSREVQEQLAGVWIHENAELAGMRKAEIQIVKSFASRTVDRARPAYGHFLKKQARHSIEVGTTNDSEYLQSQSGNRRFWPMRLTGTIDLAKLKRDRLQLWGEAAHYESKGESLTLPEAMWAAAGVEQEARRVKDPWEAVLANLTPIKGKMSHWSHVYRDGWQDRIATADILEHVLFIPIREQNKQAQMRVAESMRALGWKRTTNGRVTIKGQRVMGYFRNVPRRGGPRADSGGPTKMQETAARVGQGGPAD